MYPRAAGDDRDHRRSGLQRRHGPQAARLELTHRAQHLLRVVPFSTTHKPLDPSVHESTMSAPDSPGSPLSELSSQAFEEDDKTEDRSLSVDTYHDADHESARPTKRQRTGGPSGLSNYRAHSPEMSHHQEAEPDIYISEDTEGSVPASPNHPAGFSGMQDEESLGQDQVTVCKWEGCDVGDLGNMDKLVDHLHDDHIGTRQKKYSCEWSDCARKGIPHASGYALRAHMRSHTREKPFYCTLPGKTRLRPQSRLWSWPSMSPMSC